MGNADEYHRSNEHDLELVIRGADNLPHVTDLDGIRIHWRVLCRIATDALEKDSRLRGRALMQPAANLITFENVSKFYGEVLGVNRVSLAIEPGITSLVGPN